MFLSLSVIANEAYVNGDKEHEYKCLHDSYEKLHEVKWNGYYPCESELVSQYEHTVKKALSSEYIPKKPKGKGDGSEDN